ncbi:MAG TPA: DUF397 domain-containing protein [Pseudonocardiaceae bacterium]|nr:DUF397 domain-containing protein [Pseudonocardiaceae bacterium]
MTYPAPTACVELGHGVPGCALVRDSKDRQGAVLRFSQRQWLTFATALKAGDFD